MLDLDESTVREAVQRLGTIGWSRLASGPGSRAAKYRQLFDEALGLLPSETALLAVLMLRGPQTAAELRARSERLHHFASVPDVESTLERLVERELAQRQERRPGTREERWMHLLGEDSAVASTEPRASRETERRLARRTAGARRRAARRARTRPRPSRPR